MCQPKELGQYHILKQIGEGGMGTVFLAYDTVCKRNIAIKRIRLEETNRERFLEEALITCQLSHPSIISIYSIIYDKDLIYYTMPFIEGKTLKEFLFQEKESIFSLCHLFLQICQAVSYAHSKGFIHRDLKPSNIMVGNYGEVVLLDWGLVKKRDDVSKEEKISGTLSYLAPEVLYGQPSSNQSEIYSLGMILYEMLTLRHPFHRSNSEECSKNMETEVLVAPELVAPHRNICPFLSHITLKCLSRWPQNRYQQVDDLIADLRAYLYGESHWIQIADLVTRRMKLEARVKIVDGAIGFLLCEDHLVELSDPFIKKECWYRLRIETSERVHRLFLDDELYHVAVSNVPYMAAGIQVLLPEKSSSVIEDIEIFINTSSLKADHFQAADRLLAYKQYEAAYREYQQIASITGSQKALFYAGISKLMQSKTKALDEFKKLSDPLLECLGEALVYEAKNEYEKEILCFEKIFKFYRNHPLFSEVEERFSTRVQKCQTKKIACHFFLLAARYSVSMSVQAFYCLLDFKKQQEALFFFSNCDVEAWEKEIQYKAFAIQFAFWLARDDLLSIMIDEIVQGASVAFPLVQNALFALLELGKWEIVQQKLDLLFQRFLDVQAVAKLEWIQEAVNVHKKGFLPLKETFFAKLPYQLDHENLEPLWHILEEALDQQKTAPIHESVQLLEGHRLSIEQQQQLDLYCLWAFLLDRNFTAAHALFKLYPMAKVRREAISLNFLYGCWLAATEGKASALAHFSKLKKIKALSSAWIPFFLLIEESKQLETWLEQAFLWEKRRFWRRASLFSFCIL